MKLRKIIFPFKKPSCSLNILSKKNIFKIYHDFINLKMVFGIFSSFRHFWWVFVLRENSRFLSWIFSKNEVFYEFSQIPKRFWFFHVKVDTHVRKIWKKFLLLTIPGNFKHWRNFLKTNFPKFKPKKNFFFIIFFFSKLSFLQNSIKKHHIYFTPNKPSLLP